MTTKIYDEVCSWPYHEPYGLVAAPKQKKKRKPRRSRAKAKWLNEPRTHARLLINEALAKGTFPLPKE